MPQKVYAFYLDTRAVTCRILVRSRAALRLQGRLTEGLIGISPYKVSA
jgi:hypothetical protein